MAPRRTKQTKVTVDRLEDTPKFDHNNRCMACGTHCKSRRSQLAHAIGQHLSDATPENRALKWPFLCDYCGKGFPQDATLRSHINAKHTGKKPHRCEFPPCTEAAAYQSSIYRHMEAKHNWLPKNPRKERVGKARNREPEDAQENASGQDSASREAEEADAGRAGPSRTARSTRRAAPYSKPASQKTVHNALDKPAPIVSSYPLPTKTASFAGVKETPRPIHLTHGAQPIQQKDIYYETHPSQYRGYYTNPYQQGYYDNAAATAPYLPAPAEYAPAPVYSHPTPAYDSSAPADYSPAPVYNPSLPILPPAAYGGDSSNYPATRDSYAAYNDDRLSNANPGSSTSCNKPSMYASMSSSSFYSTTSLNSFCSASSTAPQLSASDIKFAGFSFSSTNAAHTMFYPATSDSSYAAQVNGSSPLDTNPSFSPVADASSAYEVTPVSSQEPLPDLSQGPLLDLSQGQLLDFSQDSFMDFSQDALLDLYFPNPQMGDLDFTFAESFAQSDTLYDCLPESGAMHNASPKTGPTYAAAAEADAPCNSSPESDASLNYSSECGMPCNPSPKPTAPCSPYDQVFDDFINAEAMS